MREAKNASFASSMRRVDNGARRSIPRTGLGRALVLDVPERWEELYRQDCKRIKRSATKANVAEFVAQMKDFAREGISRDMEDNEPGIRCVAAPVRDAQGHIVAAISVSSAVMYMDETRMNELAKKVRGVAEKISTQLGYNALNALESRP
ncbi:IclR family transcriptional regulator C-terminal domain-containing protein [Actinotignum urinale]|uniref:IclR family transcriptional regulator domain-containing protein n=1 Tax=Actinotignum urinale TaxID=190146 RepID=UPI002A82B735|nr:IclR family transcriptional regulator C-terminal domain-containing protein [Actinotignum urinale]MDY5128756.1 IclR family transcriptional regulator C-terminal domain-containing protein [Actinotignum urinale]